MKIRLAIAFLLVLAFAGAATAQDSGSTPPQGQHAGGWRGGRGGYGGGMGMMGRGTMGTVTEAAADHYTIKTETGDIYTVHIDSNTRIVKQSAGGGMRGQGGNGQGASGGEGMGGGMGRGNPPQEIKAGDIKVGDMIRAVGDVDATAKTVAARAVMQFDPATVQQIKEMEANFGKTWLAGKVTSIDGTKITLTGAMDNAPHAIVADENTTFRKRRDPVTLADIQVGDVVRVEGAVKNGTFVATAVADMGVPQERNGEGGPGQGQEPGQPVIAPQ